MNQLCSAGCQYLRSPSFVLGGAVIFSLLALIIALFSEAVLTLEPCRLCIYQRIPYAAIILLGLAGLAMRNKPAAPFFVLLCGLTFLANSAIAAYHTGVELHWWQSFVEGCTVPADFGAGGEQSMLENILSAPTGSCDEIPWADPVLGLSMANYNVVLCFTAGVACLASFILARKQK
jgi:disulfide bond formation protein DsbB